MALKFTRNLAFRQVLFFHQASINNLCKNSGTNIHIFAKSNCLKFSTLQTFAKRSGLHNKLTKNWTLAQSLRYMNSRGAPLSDRTVLYYSLALIITMGGVTYVCAPLYKKFCQQAGLGGKAEAIGHDVSKVKTMKPVRERVITVEFFADKHANMQWNFRPTQRKIQLVPGETALAFYKARNPTDKPIIGVSTYNVLPYRAALYFNKIQCFCFEEQRLNPGEEVDLPVFFYIDPDYTEDPQLLFEDTITLSYTFFEAKPGMEIPMPEWMQKLNEEEQTPQANVG